MNIFLVKSNINNNNMSKSKRISKNSRSNKGSTQFARTTRKTGKWRGKSADKYIKYIKKKKMVEFVSQFIHPKKYGNQ